MKTAKDLELSLLVKEANIQQLKYKIDKTISSMEHELYGHILQNDEDSWNPEFYTDEKLDYRKLLIYLLKEYINDLKYKGYKDPYGINWNKEE